MTTPLVRFRPVFVFAAAAIVVVGFSCSRRDRDQAGEKVREAYAETKAAASKAWDDVKSFSFEQRDKFEAKAKAMSSQMEAQASELQASYSDAKASAARRAAMAELKSAEADYQQKVAALGQASAATWASAKQNVIASWDRLEAAYYRARAD